MAATRALEAAAELDDAYMMGSDPVSGLKVATVLQRAAVERIVEVHGQQTCWVSPDEVAVMMASEQFKKIPGSSNLFRAQKSRIYVGCDGYH
jgi:hypothetical protein